LGNLSQLTILELQNNTFIGILPMELYQLTNLETLNLSYNQFYGNIDQSLGNLLNLKVLELSQNSFSGKLPYTIGNLTQLTRLMLHNNSFIADIPPAVGLMSELKVLQFQHNNFDEIPDLSSIDSVLICSMNKLTFEDFERNLEIIRNTEATFSYAPQQKFNREYDTTAVEGNPFTLTIPCGGVYNHYKWFKDSVEIDWADDASSLFFAEIQLTDMGTYHITVTNDSVPNLELISFPVHLNVIEHCLKFDSLALVALYLATDGPNWTNKENWLVKGTRLNDWFGVETDSCNVLKVELASNNLKGTLPAEITELEMLSVLDLGKNGISGSLPTDIGLLSNLETLKINDNLISGNIPNTLWDLTKLKVLDLNNNVLTGSIASGIGQLVNLEYLDLGTNRYSGSIPREIGLLTNLRYLDISFTPLAGSLPNELGNLLLLQTLRLSNSNYSGVLPTGLTNLTKLDTLELQSNFFRGNIPSFSGNPSLDFMNVANNKYLFGDLHTATINLEKINYIYSPQDTILDIDYDFEMSTLNVIDDNFTGNIYSWYLNNIEMKTTGNPIVINEKGVYYCLVTNPAFPELTLETIKLEVDTVKLELVDLFPVNLVIIGSGYNPYFIVPGLERYPNNNFALFTKWGNLVYRKSGYANELDLSIYPAGTYYYVLTYTLREKHKQIKNFVDLIKK
jgi:Leucine-rich repeat (LRR) protein